MYYSADGISKECLKMEIDNEVIGIQLHKGEGGDISKCAMSENNSKPTTKVERQFCLLLKYEIQFLGKLNHIGQVFTTAEMSAITHLRLRRHSRRNRENKF